MIELITAVPGSGKTLYTIAKITEKAKKEDRQVYYSGIPLTEEGRAATGWLELDDPLKWFELPPLSIVIIDECQRIFPKRPNGAPVPKHVSQFETHRHLGIDVYLITQGPKLLDTHIRDLIGRHVHLNRIFGMQAAKVFGWDGCQIAPESNNVKANCLDVQRFIYPKQVYSWYKSAEAHTHKVKIPRKVWLTLAALIFTIVMCFVSFRLVAGFGKSSVPGTGQQSASAPASQQPPRSTDSNGKPIRTVQDVINDRVPVVRGIPESEPRYNDMVKPRSFPYIAACVASKTKCSCYTQQATLVDGVTDVECRDRVDRGRFNPYVEVSNQQQSSPSQQPVQQPQGQYQGAAAPVQQQGLAMGDANPQENRFDQLRHPGLALKKSAGTSSSSVK